VAPIGAENESFSSSGGFEINFVTRQNLKLTEDLIIDVQDILQTLESTVVDIRDQCWKFGQKKNDISEEEQSDLQLTIEELIEDIKEIQMLTKRADLLREKAKSTTQLVSYYLGQTIEGTADKRIAC
jgi:hypothetical protein